MRSVSIKLCDRFSLLILGLFISGAVMAQSAPEKTSGTASSRNDDTVGEISIVGSTELPNMSFSLPWQLPTVESRDKQKPPKELAGMFEMLDPVRHRKQIYFERYLQVEMPSYQVK